MAWFWIELSGTTSPISPSSDLVFDIPGQHQVYTLRAVIYHGMDHFTARFPDQLGTWWKYDGMWNTSVLRVDHVENEVDLLENDNRQAAYLLYCRADFRE